MNIDTVKINQIFKQGGVIVFSTDTVYGIGCDPYNEEAIDKIYEVKKRPREKVMPVLVSGKIRDELLLGNLPENIDTEILARSSHYHNT